jgi:hypothetical protein
MPTEISSEEEIFSDIKTAEQALGRLYWTLYWDHSSSNENNRSFLREGFISELTACTDETVDHWETPPSRLLYNAGLWTTTDNPAGEWKLMYNFIRRANQFIDNIDKVELKATQLEFYSERVKEYKEEVRFLRAYYYFDLLRQYGAVPLTTNVIDISVIENAVLPRNSVDEIVNFISSECDIAAQILPDSYTSQDLGRITKGTCLALKSRTLLYGASPLFNGNTLYAGVKNSDGKQLFAQTYDKDKWLKAARSARSVIDWAPSGSIILDNPNPGNAIDNYAKLFSENTNSNEIILRSLVGEDFAPDYTNTSNASDYGGVGKYSVLQEMVDAYETSTGYLPFRMNEDGCVIYDAEGKPEIDPRSGYTETGFFDGQVFDGRTMRNGTNISTMYQNRDPRFYASILYQGAYWKAHLVNRPQWFPYWLNNNNNNFEGNKKLIGKNNETGYSVRKFLNPDVNLRVQWRISHHFPLFRLAEQYLNCAEAWNEYLDTPNDSVYDAINAVRARVGMPLLPITPEDGTKVGMRQRIRNERRVELFFESHRFWDVRRWMIAKTVDGTTVHGMNSLPQISELEEAAAANGLDLTKPAESKLAGLAVFYKRTKYMDRVFQDKHYLFPIPQTEIDRNNKLVQNYGW